MGFFIPVSSLKVFGHSIHSERRRIYLGKSIQLTVLWHTLKTFLFVFINFCSSKKTFQDSRLLKYLINKELVTFSNKIQAKTFTGPDMSFYAR